MKRVDLLELKPLNPKIGAISYVGKILVELDKNGSLSHIYVDASKLEEHPLLPTKKQEDNLMENYVPVTTRIELKYHIYDNCGNRTIVEAMPPIKLTLMVEENKIINKPSATPSGFDDFFDPTPPKPVQPKQKNGGNK